jgi:hypothetical protein
VSFDAARLFELLPAFYRIRDVETAARIEGTLDPQEQSELAEITSRINALAAGETATLADSLRLRELEWKRDAGPLRALVSILGEQVAVLEEDLDQLYDDQFIETCAEWVVPYIGDLVGARGIAAIPGARYSQRAEVANTIGFRRRKGTASMLEELARSVTQWDAAVVEYFLLLATTQSMIHIRPDNLSFASVRERHRELPNTPFDRTAHNAEVRNISRGSGKYNIPNVGIHLFPIQPYPVTDGAPYQLDALRWFFDPLGRDIPLYNEREAETTIEHLATPANVPLPIRRRFFATHRAELYPRSVTVALDDADVPETDIRVCDLSDSGTTWAHLPAASLPSGARRVIIDPELGRLALSSPAAKVRVTYHYGFSDAIGGGEYPRAEVIDDADAEIVPVAEGGSIADALQDLLDIWSAGGELPNGIVELRSSTYFAGPVTISIPEGKRIEIRAADGVRPVVVLTGTPTIAGARDSSCTLNGLLLAGEPIAVPEQLGGQANLLNTLRILHCTLAPSQPPAIESWTRVGPPPQARLVVGAANTRVELVRSISGAIRVVSTGEALIEDSMVDAGVADAVAYAGPEGDPGAPLEVLDSTIVGRVSTRRMAMASNSIFDARGTLPVYADQIQEGCVRFSFVPLGSRVPRRYRCQPATDAQAAEVRPVFRSLRFGDPAYMSLTRSTSPLIRTGADDGAEMGVFHDLHQPQREANLRARLEEYLRFGLEAGIFQAG